MQTFRGTVNLNGDRNNQVFKSEMTAPEVILLRALHGDEMALSDLTITGDKPRDSAWERNRLEVLYVSHEKSRKEFEDVLGKAHIPLPVALPGFEWPIKKAAKKVELEGPAADFGEI